MSIARLLAARLIGIVRLDDLEQTIVAAGAAVEAGLEVIEVTFTLPTAARAIDRLRCAYPAACVGAGTVRTLADLDEAAESGAQFLIAPGLNLELLAAAQRLGLPFIPGVFTASEVDLGLRAGAELLKVFPAEPLGPPYISALLQPFPQARLMPTGGVTIGNAAAYLSAGAVAIAIGSSLFPARRIAAEGPEIVRPLVEAALAVLQ